MKPKKTDEGKNKTKLEEKNEEKSEMSEDKCVKDSSENDKKKEEKEDKTETNVNEETLTAHKEEEEIKEKNEKNDDTKQSEGCHIETMLGYVNNGDNLVSTEESVKKFEGDSVTQMIFKGETDSEKEERMAVIG